MGYLLYGEHLHKILSCFDEGKYPKQSTVLLLQITKQKKKEIRNNVTYRGTIMEKKIVIGCDHAGFGLKGKVVDHLEALGYEVIDVGTNSTDSCDYPVFAHRLCKKIQDGEAPLGILICVLTLKSEKN